MGVLVDTSVWSLLLHRKSPGDHPARQALQNLILQDEPVCLTGIIYQEILQGTRSESHFTRLKGLLLDFDFLEATSAVHETAARVFKSCRARGVQAATADCLIAALAIEHKTLLLTTDKDFHRMAEGFPLKFFAY